jgi:hypothetical protein
MNPQSAKRSLAHLEMEANVADWRNWAIGAGIEPSIIAYISHRLDALFVFNAESR